MIILSNVIITNMGKEIHAIEFLEKKLISVGFFKDKYCYIYKDALDLNSDYAYKLSDPVTPIHAITFYMTEDEIERYMSNSLNEAEVYKIIARAIKYEQSKINELEQNNIKKLIKSEYKD